MCAGYIDDVLISSCKSTEEFSPVEDLEAKLRCSFYLFIMRQDRSRLNKIIRLKIIDVCGDLAVIYPDPLFLKDLRPLRRMVIRTSDYKTCMLCKSCESVH